MLAAREAAQSQINPLILAQSRATISFLILAPILLLRRREKAAEFAPADIFRCMLIGILGLAASNFFYYYAIEKTTVATAIIVQYTAPVWVLLYMVVRRLQPATWMRALAVALALFGSALAVGVLRASPAWPQLRLVGVKMDPLGVGAALVAAFSFSFYSIYGQIQVKRYDRWYVVLFAMLGAAVLWLVVNPPWKVFAAHYSARQWLFLLVFALASMLIPLSLYFAGLQYLDATRAIVTSCLEPVFAILFAGLFVHESAGPTQVMGMVFVVLATILIQLPEGGRIAAPSEIAPVD